ncbi:MAG: hypothetical protein IPK19_36640 [Chloroflexi bacterium]|nr:hypothetical protein [Chloroflexota bacterium]
MTLRGFARITASILWFALFAGWLAYLIGFWWVGLERARYAVCDPFMPANMLEYLPLCVGITAASELLVQIIFGIAATILFLRKPDEVMTMLASAMLLILSGGISNVTLGLSIYPATEGLSRFMLGAGLWTAAMVFLLFPDGRFRPRWTWAIGAVYGLWVVSWWVIPALDMTRRLTLAAYPVLAFSLLPSVGAVWIGYRSYYTPTQQQQTKWVVVGVVSALLIYTIFVLTALIIRTPLRGRSPGWSSTSLRCMAAGLACRSFRSLSSFRWRATGSGMSIWSSVARWSSAR